MRSYVALHESSISHRASAILDSQASVDLTLYIERGHHAKSTAKKKPLNVWRKELTACSGALSDVESSESSLIRRVFLVCTLAPDSGRIRINAMHA